MFTPRSLPHLTLIVLVLLATPASARKRDTGFLNRTLTLGSTSYRYQIYVPVNWDTPQKWPVILFLHGAGERGEDGLLQTEVGIGAAIRRNPERFPCIVVLPQCRKSQWWTAAEMEAQALKALELSIKEFKGDSDRIYITGLSMGGYGTWSIASKNPARFAALAPICGGVRPPPNVPNPAGTPKPDPSVDLYAEVARKVVKTPVWIFHGGADNVVPVSESRKMAAALKSAGGNVRYTEYEGVGHNSWDKAYRDPAFVSWLLGQKR